MIRAGKVTLNGHVIRDAETPVRMLDSRIAERIEVDGLALDKKPPVYLVMNKPRGVVTTASDEKGRKTVYDLLDPGLSWVGPVGRLDKASEGLLLLTNDSEWAAAVTEPDSHLDKKYHVQVDRVVNEELLARITKGCVVEGDNLCAKEARLLRHGEKNSWLEITLDEGKNRQIRRLLEALEVQVLRLVRVSVGPLVLGDLKKGAVRNLTAEEKQRIDQALAR